MGVISEAGCPAIADPGADIVAMAQRKKIKVVPLVGPSSILMAIMASGFNGQSFAFNGYLPAKPAERVSKLKQLENKIYKNFLFCATKPAKINTYLIVFPLLSTCF